MGDQWKDWEDPNPTKWYKPGDFDLPFTLMMKLDFSGRDNVTVSFNPDGTVTWDRATMRESSANAFYA